MSKRSRILRAARAELGREPQPVTKLSGPGDAIVMIPYLLGFTPHDSLVVIGLQGPRQRIGPCFRMDLVSAHEEVAAQADYAASLVELQSHRRVMLFAFSDVLEPAQTVLHEVRRRLAVAGVDVVDAVRADGSRWWSTVCADALCCGPEGTPYDVETSRVAAEAVLAGLPRAPDREALRAQVSALSRERQAAVAAAAAGKPVTAGVADLVRSGLGRADKLSVAEIAELALAVQRVDVRDEAWTLMTRANAGQHFALWRTVMQSVPEEMLCPVGSLAAFAAWLNGNGVLASHAAERVVAVDPDYSMAQLVLSALETCLHPDTWQSVRQPVR